MQRDILFLDANVLFSAAYCDQAGILQFWSLAKTKLITSEYAAEEARRNLKHIEQVDRLEKLICDLQIIHEYHSDLIPNEIALAHKDRPILAAAIGGNATHLITGDYKDFGRYYKQKIAGILILPPAEYLRSIKQ